MLRTISRCALSPVGVLLLVSLAHGQPTIGLNFQGSTRHQSGFRPPDTMAAVGKAEIVELINGRYAVYSKTDGSVLDAKSLNDFWAAAGAAPIEYAFDPRVLYDALADRWFACSVDNVRAANSFLVAVSVSGDPTMGWMGFRIDGDSDDSHWADFPMMGLNAEVLVITANMFPLDEAPVRTAVLVLPKVDLLAGSVANATLFEDLDGAMTGYTPQPVVDLDQGPLPLVLLSSYSKPGGLLKISAIGGTPADPVLATDGGLIQVTPRGMPPDVDQPGPKSHVHAGDHRFCANVIMKRLEGRSSPSLWAAHGVDIDGRAAIEWYEIDAATQTIIQNGTLSDTNLAFNYPSLAINETGDVVIGCSGGSPDQFLSTFAFVGATLDDQTTFAEPLLLKAGASDYESLDNDSRNRWGDYSATLLDPLNPTVFWTIQEFVLETDVWATQITQLSVSGTMPGVPWVLNYPAPNTVWRLLDGAFQMQDGSCRWSRIYGFPPQFALVRGTIACDPPTFRYGLGLVLDGQLTGLILQLDCPPLVLVTGHELAQAQELAQAVPEPRLSKSAALFATTVGPAIPEPRVGEIVNPAQTPQKINTTRAKPKARSVPAVRTRSRAFQRSIRPVPRPK